MTSVPTKPTRRIGLRRRAVRSTYQPVPFWDRYENSSRPLLAVAISAAAMATATAGVAVGLLG
jgi:hypothetical protein